METHISRRQFMTGLAATAVGSVCLPRMAWAVSGPGPTSTIYVVHGSDPGRMLAAGIDRLGGWGGFVKPRKNVVLKLNAAWASLPEQGGNTSPALIVIDALRIMITHGPQGPGKLDYPNQLIFGMDPVAVDAYAATLFGKQPFDVLHIKLAHDMGVGCGDLKQVRIVHVDA